METTTVYTLKFKGALMGLAEDKASEYPADLVKSWEFEHVPYSGASAIKVGLKLAEKKIGPQFGVDAQTVDRARALEIIKEIVKKWDQEVEGSPLPITEENIGLLPPIVLQQFGNRIEFGLFPTFEDLEALKNSPLEKKSDSTSKPD